MSGYFVQAFKAAFWFESMGRRLAEAPGFALARALGARTEEFCRLAYSHQSL